MEKNQQTDDIEKRLDALDRKVSTILRLVIAHHIDIESALDSNDMLLELIKYLNDNVNRLIDDYNVRKVNHDIAMRN